LIRSQEQRGPGWLHRMLARLDPASAERIHANDHSKLVRALEVCFAAKQPLSQAFEAGRDPLTGFRLLRIGINPDRAALYARLNDRAAAMFAAGLVEETRGLLGRYGRIRALEALGYRQALGVLDGTLTLREATTAAQQGHRNYAKRQLTWFRREPGVHWLEGFGDSAEVMEAAFGLVRDSLIVSS
jgi:tRNA dimethylallyltransferase